ncbi:hypothetical protein KEM55_007115 [Ascosphaera atra]|nr:hypothetical protein KEM55_007115 [Ascosphaera atra]
MMRRNYFALILSVLAIAGLGSAAQQPPVPSPNGGMLEDAITDRNSVSGLPDSEFVDVLDPQTRLSTPDCDRVMCDKTRASNPFGIAACYNVLSYDTANGSFEGYLAVYRVSAPAKEACNDSILNISWAVHHAVLMPPNHAELRITHGGKEGPVKLLSRAKVRGQLSGKVPSSSSSRDDLQAALLPEITLSVRSHSCEKDCILTLPNEDIVSFFSVNASPAAHQQQVIEGFSKRDSVDKEFHMPGRTLGIYPTGLIITSVWAALLVAVVGRLRKEIARRERNVMATQ